MLKKIFEKFSTEKVDFKIFDYDLTIKKTKKKKTISIIVRNGKVIVSCPIWTVESKIKKILLSKEKWIKKNIYIYTQREDIINDNKRNGIYLFKGEKVKLKYENFLIESVNYKDNYILIRTSNFSNTNVDKLLSEWLRLQATHYIRKRLKFYSDLMHIKFSNLLIKSYRSRWGSCDTKGKITINWRLIMAPPSILDYVIIHELSHIPHPNHSKTFWMHIKKYKPYYQRDANWLRENGFLLNSQFV